MTVDATGLTIPTLREVKESIETKQKAIDPTIVTATEEPLGQINPAFAEASRETWETAQIAYNGFNPDAVEGFLLDALGALTGTVRKKPTYTIVTASIDIDAGTTLVSGTHFAHVDGAADRRFTPVEDYTSPSDGSHDVDFQAEELGPVVCNASTLTEIATPVTGWNSITNAADGELGSDEESDSDYRARREARLQASGSGTVGALASGVAGVDGVVTATTFENYTDEVDANGLPPHSYEVLVFDGETPAASDDEIAQAIWDNRPAGIQPYGSESGTAVDSAGDSHTIYFTRPTIKPVYIEIAFDGSVSLAAIAAYIVPALQASNSPGKDVIYNEIISEIINAGATDVTTLEIGFSASPSGTSNLSIGVREISSYDTGRVDPP